jgi:hypothetical protein
LPASRISIGVIAPRPSDSVARAEPPVASRPRAQRLAAHELHHQVRRAVREPRAFEHSRHARVGDALGGAGLVEEAAGERR